MVSASSGAPGAAAAQRSRKAGAAALKRRMSDSIDAKPGRSALEPPASSPASPPDDHSSRGAPAPPEPDSDTEKLMSDGSVGTPSASNSPHRLGYVDSL